MYSLVFNLGTLVACVVLGFYLFRKRPGATGTAPQPTPVEGSADSPAPPEAE